MTETKEREAFFKVHANLPRQGPGSDLMTQTVISQLPPLPRSPRIVDAGCGPGRSTLILAGRFDTMILAVDLHEPFLKQLRDNASNAGLAHRIEVRCGDMAKLGEPEQSVDLIWSEGAIYNIGFDHGLECWHPWLKKEAVVAVSELSWLTASPTPAALSFWHKNYAGMRSLSENRQAAARLGYECLHALVLPAACWWDEYYGALRKNIERLALEGRRDPFLAKAALACTQEIDLYENHSSEYGYVFYILQKS